MSDAKPPADDPALVQACLAGDQNAWNELVERYGRLVYSIPLRMHMSPQDADDVFQIVFGIVLRHLGSLRDHGRLAAWLIRTTHRECWSYKKAKRRQQEYELTDNAAPDDPAPEEMIAWERQHLVRQAMGNLDSRCRELLERLFFSDPQPSYEQIASELAIPIGSIGPTRGRCFKKLEALLSDVGL